MRPFWRIAPRLLGFFSRDLDAEPGPRIGPPAVRRAGRDAEHRRRLVEVQAGEGPQLEKLRLLRLEGSEASQGLIQGQQTLVALRSGQRDLVEVEALQLAAAFVATSAPGIFNQDAPHGLRGG